MRVSMIIVIGYHRQDSSKGFEKNSLIESVVTGLTNGTPHALIQGRTNHMCPLDRSLIGAGSNKRDG